MMAFTTTPLLAEKRLRIAFFILLGAAAVLRIYMLALDMNILLDQGLVQDDAFYYYVIAHHITENGFSSFDGINLTNGFHPLWQFISLPIFYPGSSDAPVRIMLGIACLFDLLSIVLLYRVLKRVLKKNYAILCGVAILAFHGTIIRTWFNGLETALSLFCLLWLLLHFLKLYQSIEASTDRDHLWFGFIAAITFLARTDNAVIILSLFAFLYIPALFKLNIKQGVFSSSVLLLVIGPWLIWNIAHFGTIVQISGQVRENTWLVDSARGEQSFFNNIIHGITASILPLGNVLKKMFIPTTAPDIYGYFFILLAIPFIVLYRKKNTLLKESGRLLFPFILGVMVLFFYHTGVRHFVRGWYNAPVLLAFTLMVCLLLDALFSQWEKPRFSPGVFIVLTSSLLIFYSPYRYTKTPVDSSLDPRVQAARWVNQNTPANAIVGAANAGIVGYYMNRPVVNLDGVVNENAFRARLANHLHQYIDDAGIDYLVDHKGSIAYLCSENSYFTCSLEASWDSTYVMQVHRKMPGQIH